MNNGHESDPEEEFTALVEEVTREFQTSSLSVNVDWLDLVEHCDSEDQAWEIVRRLKELLG